MNEDVAYARNTESGCNPLVPLVNFFSFFMERSDIGQGASFIRELSGYDVRCMGVFVTTLEKFENGGFTLKILL